MKFSKIKNITLKNFKVHENFSTELSENISILVGDNATGKTSVIDAFFYTSVCDSIKSIDPKNLIKFGKDFSVIKIETEIAKLKCTIEQNKRSFFINETEIKKIREFVGVINTIIFTPEDVSFFSGSPSNRRKLIDQELSKINKSYLDNLIQFRTLLAKRNSVLKNTKKLDENTINVLKSIDEMFSEVQAKIIIDRKLFIDGINEYCTQIYKSISNSNSQINLTYKPTIPVKTFEYNDLCMQLRYIYSKSYEKDLITKQTNMGIHRDDVGATLNEFNIGEFCSQGENRTAILSVKLSIANFILKNYQIKPIILLDDVLSELDEKRQNSLVFELNRQQFQTIITTTSLNEISETLKNMSKIIKIG